MAKQPNMVSDPMLLQAALEGLELQKRRIDEQIRHVRELLGGKSGRMGRSADIPADGVSGERRHLSDAARKRIATAQKKRWAEYRKSHPAQQKAH